jgi:hypothetical protein
MERVKKSIWGEVQRYSGSLYRNPKGATTITCISGEEVPAQDKETGNTTDVTGYDHNGYCSQTSSVFLRDVSHNSLAVEFFAHIFED